MHMQVLSESVWKALQLTGGPEVEETVRFISFFDKFFDCFNVSSYSAGRRHRKVFQQPYRSSTDFRLKVDYWHVSTTPPPTSFIIMYVLYAPYVILIVAEGRIYPLSG